MFEAAVSPCTQNERRHNIEREINADFCAIRFRTGIHDTNAEYTAVISILRMDNGIARISSIRDKLVVAKPLIEKRFTPGDTDAEGNRAPFKDGPILWLACD